ncbi:hypothetical protein AB1Y20_015447 [Prymnesium parvum]|uniref:Uncharacterized protein n=1 Tax=Prymnesium parvum TaxID=97485 RepID=A0AB34K0Y2_PRYPA
MARPPEEGAVQTPDDSSYYVHLDDGEGYNEYVVDIDHPEASAEEASTAAEGEWKEGKGVEGAADDEIWEGAPSPLEPHDAAWVAEFDPNLDGTSQRPPLPQEHVELIKATMATLQIAPPPWVRKMQQLQRIQLMQQQMQQLTAQEGQPAGPLVLPDGARASSLAVAEQAWAQHLQQRTPGGHLLSQETIADASPLALPLDATTGALSTPVGLASGMPGMRRKITSKQLAAERRKARSAAAATSRS